MPTRAPSILVTLAAVGDETLAAHIRHATIARGQDNRCFAAASFLVGRNYMAADEGSAPAFTGKSGIYAPLEMTPRVLGRARRDGDGGGRGPADRGTGPAQAAVAVDARQTSGAPQTCRWACSAAICRRFIGAAARWPTCGPRSGAGQRSLALHRQRPSSDEGAPALVGARRRGVPGDEALDPGRRLEPARAWTG